MTILLLTVEMLHGKWAFLHLPIYQSHSFTLILMTRKELTVASTILQGRSMRRAVNKKYIVDKGVVSPIFETEISQKASDVEPSIKS